MERNECIVAPSLAQNLCAIKGVGMLDTANCFGRPDSVCIVGVSVSIKRFKLSSLFPSQSMTEVGCRVALCIVGNGLVTILCKQVFLGQIYYSDILYHFQV